MELIGANGESIDKAEDRQKFRVAMDAIGLERPRSTAVHSMEEGPGALRVRRLADDYPTVFHHGRYRRRHRLQPRRIRRDLSQAGLRASPTTKCWSTNQCSAGKNTRWRSSATARTTASSSARSKTSIPMGVHTGDSITVAPALTLTDKEYQIMRNASIAVLREIGVDTGGSNVQFAVARTPAGCSSSR